MKEKNQSASIQFTDINLVMDTDIILIFNCSSITAEFCLPESLVKVLVDKVLLTILAIK